MNLISLFLCNLGESELVDCGTCMEYILAPSGGRGAGEDGGNGAWNEGASYIGKLDEPDDVSGTDLPHMLGLGDVDVDTVRISPYGYTSIVLDLGLRVSESDFERSRSPTGIGGRLFVGKVNLVADAERGRDDDCVL